jgi:hypothetical protein
MRGIQRSAAIGTCPSAVAASARTWWSRVRTLWY